MHRRGFIFGIASCFAIVKPEIIMPIKQLWVPDFLEPGTYQMKIIEAVHRNNAILLTLELGGSVKKEFSYVV